MQARPMDALLENFHGSRRITERIPPLSPASLQSRYETRLSQEFIASGSSRESSRITGDRFAQVHQA